MVVNKVTLSLKIRVWLVLICGGLALAGSARGATQVVYGLESVKFERVLDPNARPVRLRLVSGILKLTGEHYGANTWETVTHIPRKTAAPRSDYGIFVRAGNQFRLYSFLTFSTYTGTLTPDGEWLSIQKVNRYGQSQTETWLLRP